MTKEVIASLFIEKSLICLYQNFPYSSTPNVLIYRACDLLGTRPVSQVIYWGKKCKQGFMVSAAEFIPLTSQLEIAPGNKWSGFNDYKITPYGIEKKEKKKAPLSYGQIVKRFPNHIVIRFQLGLVPFGCLK